MNEKGGAAVTPSLPLRDFQTKFQASQEGVGLAASDDDDASHTAGNDIVKEKAMATVMLNFDICDKSRRPKPLPRRRKSKTIKLGHINAGDRGGGWPCFCSLVVVDLFHYSSH